MKNLTIKKREKDQNHYTELQKKTLKRISELSSKVWTDYNAHDPGITISDYLNYALYDLYYRFQFPFENYLFDSEHDRKFSEKGLFDLADLYTEIDSKGEVKVRKSIVTEKDYEDLFLEYLSIFNIKIGVRFNIRSKKYDIFLKFIKDFVSDEAKNKIKRDITKIYHQHRNLCENLGEFYFDFDKIDNPYFYENKKYDRKEKYTFPEFEKVENQNPPKVFSPIYESIQYEFPETYGLSKRGIPNTGDIEYEKKVLQLKAYILIFDILIADHLTQTKNIHKLFELNEELPSLLFPDVDIVDGDRIVDKNKKELAESKLKDERYFNLQKVKYFNLLDALYNEDTKRLVSKKELIEHNQKRAALLRFLPKLNEFRFRSFNLDDPHSIPDVQQLLEEIVREKFSNQLSLLSNKVRIVSDDLFFDRYRFLLKGFLEENKEGEEFNPMLFNISGYDENDSYEKLRLHMNLIWHGIIPESLLEYGLDIENYSIVSVFDEYLVLFKHPQKKVFIKMSLFSSDKNKLIEMTHLFIDFLYHIKVNGFKQALYFVEHILLESNPNNSNLLSIVIHEKLKDVELEAIYRERLPAHLIIRLFYVNSSDLEEFHSNYFNWRKSLANNNNKDSLYYAGVLISFFKEKYNNAVFV